MLGLTLITIILGISYTNGAGLSGDAITTGYWDCCKPSCSWTGNLPKTVKTPVASCAIDGVKVVNDSVQSGCAPEGTSYMCTNQQPWVVNDTMAYGFTAASFTGGADNQIENKRMIVQVTNTGGDLKENQFDIAFPGAGVGLFPQGCVKQWNAPQTGWGKQYGGVGTIEECSEMPSELQEGCKFRFEWYEGANCPPVSFEQVDCPDEITEKSGCL